MILRKKLVQSAAFVMLLLCGQVTLADIVLSSSSRELTAINRETAPTTTDSRTTTAFGPWNEAASVRNGSDAPNFNPAGSLVTISGSQSSSVAPNQLVMSGFLMIEYLTLFAPNAGVSATDRMDVAFHVASPTQFAFAATITNNYPLLLNGSVLLRNTTTARDVFSTSLTGSTSGLLASGDYTYTVLFQAASSGVSTAQIHGGRIDFTTTLTLPPPTAALGSLALSGMFAATRRRPRR